MSEFLKLDTVIGPGDLTVADHFLLTRANKARLDSAGIESLKPEVDKEARYSAYLSAIQVDSKNFDITVYLRNVHLVGKFSAFQFKTNFPPGVNFLGATPSSLIQHFGFGYQHIDGHPKEGLVGGYASSLDAVDGMADGIENDELFVTLHFSGPFGANFAINLDQWKLTIGSQVLPADLPENITAAP